MFCRAYIRIFPVVLLGIFCVSSSGIASDATPKERIQGAVERIQKIIRDENLSQDDRTRQIRQIARPLFDFTEMTRRAFGRHWKDLDGAQRKEAVPLFEKILEFQYLSKIELMKEARMADAKEEMEQDFARVQQNAFLKNGNEIRIDYRLHRIKGEWKIYDISAMGVSLVNNYRAQFEAVIAKSSLDDLLKKMRDKVESLERR